MDFLLYGPASQAAKALDRRSFIQRGSFAATLWALGGSGALPAQGTQAVEVASAGSIRAMLEGPLKQATTTSLHLDLHTHAGGADGIAHALINGGLIADVFLPITAAPMQTVLQAGLATAAYPVARTEMVIVYSAKSRFAPQFRAAAEGHEPWWKVLQQPGLVFARSNPLEDPSGRAILFSMMLAAKKDKVPDLVQQVLGATLNPDQIQPGRDVRKGLEDGSIDAAGSYRIATAAGTIPFVTLPADVNLSGVHPRESHPDLKLQIGNKTFFPEPLIFYAAALTTAKNPDGATAFIRFLRSQGAANLFAANGFALPTGAAPLTASDTTTAG